MMIELELINGERVLIPRSAWDKIYNLKEKNTQCLEFTKSFPFFKISRRSYVTFKLKTHYEYLASPFDPKYKVNCSLVNFAKMFDIDVKPFEVNVIENELRSI